MYDAKAIESVTGEVLKVEKVVPRARNRTQFHLRVKTEKEEIPVHLGPVWYLERQAVKIRPKDRIEVKGSWITYRGEPAFVAGEVKRGDDLIKLRDEDGIPAWGRGLE